MTSRGGFRGTGVGTIGRKERCRLAEQTGKDDVGIGVSVTSRSGVWSSEKLVGA